VGRVAALAALAACGGGASADLSVEAAGPYPVGTSQRIVEDVARGRSLRVQSWYPADEAERDDAAAGFDIVGFEPDDFGRQAYLGQLLDAAPAGCPNRQAHASIDGRHAEGSFPTIVFSHCHECARFSSFTIAERLASHGFDVIAVEHLQNTLWDLDSPDALPLDADTLEIRAGDVTFVLDALGIDGPIGIFGHSFGSVTAGLVAQEDARIEAAFGIAAPMENPLLEGVLMAEIDVPVGFLVAVEDNSITELGNTFIRDNFAAANPPAWKIEVADAGHWSFSDLVGLEPFPAGCGDGDRQTNGDPFTYLAPSLGRDIAAAYVTAFFKATLGLEGGAAAYLEAARFDGAVTVEGR
jgi:dienelactone hydrolase